MKCVSSVFILVAVFFSSSAHAEVVSPAELNARMDYWTTKVPYCAYDEGSFPSKDKCDDGDSVALNGLTCAAGDGQPGIFGKLATQACDAVKNSQGKKSGTFYRSPKKRYEIENSKKTTDEKPSSNDSAQGVWAYIAQKKDVTAFHRWTGWMQDHRLLGIWPRYCMDTQCAFNVSDCPMLDRLAVYLGEGNPLCDIPPYIPADAPIKVLQANFDGTVNAIYKLPGAHVFDAQINALKASISAALSDARNLAQQVDIAKEKFEALTRVTMHQAEFLNYISAYVNSDGPPRQDVAYAAYLLKKYGGLTSSNVDSAAKIVASKEPENAFFEYVAHGPTQLMLQQILSINGIQKCPPKTADKDHPRTSWIWESVDRQTKPGKVQPWVETMYWDCIFVGNLYNSGPIKGYNFPAVAGYEQASQEIEKQFQNIMTGTKNLLATLDQIRLKLQDPTHPPSPAQVWKLLTDAHDSTAKILPGPLQKVSIAVPKEFQPPAWTPAPPPAPTPPPPAQVVKQVKKYLPPPPRGAPRPPF
jgi:hypothetical protein